MMNWKIIRHVPWIDTRAKFVASVPGNGRLLDIGSSDGQTLNHFYELRPDLKYYAIDIQGKPENYPSNCFFFRGDIQNDVIPIEADSIDAITCMHLIEHLENFNNLLGESKRLLKANGRIYFETPHPKSTILSSPSGKFIGSFTVNFYDDRTHIKPVAIGALAQICRDFGFEIISSGVSRNLLIACLYPFVRLLPVSYVKILSYVHFIGWSSYLVCKKV